MSGRLGLIACILGSLLAGPGCVCCGHQSYGAAHEIGPECDIPTCQRNQVYVFAVSGIKASSLLALDALREELAHQGYAKVATGSPVHYWWMARTMREIHKEEPNAVFVLLGAEDGGPTAQKLAEQAVADGLPVAKVVLINGDGKKPAKTTAEAWAFAIPTTYLGSVPGVTAVLNEVALSTAPLVTVTPAQWDYPHAPAPRPTLRARDEEWAFMFAPGTPPASVTQNALVPAAATAARTTTNAVVPAEARAPGK